VFGAWSDRIGRKKIMMTGLLLAVLLYFPLYKQMYSLTDTTLKQELTGQKSITRSVTFSEEGDTIKTAKVQRMFEDESYLTETTREVHFKDASKKSLRAETKKEFTLSNTAYWIMIGLVFIQIVLVTMVYGPIAAFLVELFPTRIRYTSMSLPYHIGNGIFGGMTPFIATALFELSKTDSNPGGNPFVGLWYPIGVAAVCFVIGMIFLKTKESHNMEV